MDKIQLQTNIKRGDFYEFYAGPFRGNHWNEGSIFLQDEVFHYIEPTIGKHIDLNWYGSNEIDQRTWQLIIPGLETLNKRLEQSRSVSDLRDAIRFVAGETGAVAFAADFQGNTHALQDVIRQLVKWLNHQLEQHATIWILGI